MNFNSADLDAPAFPSQVRVRLQRKKACPLLPPKADIAQAAPHHERLRRLRRRAASGFAAPGGMRPAMRSLT